MGRLRKNTLKEYAVSTKMMNFALIIHWKKNCRKTSSLSPPCCMMYTKQTFIKRS